jgi:nitroimidazol reductase NimA-like FMN-containing flavoprotein (pyridoxamine 5'-phosphate oxidase superfamily)
MRDDRDPADVAREIIDSNSFMVLGTADADGRPWAAPVWYAPDGYSRFLWVSKPGARHSHNLAARSALAIVIFDSRVTPGEGDAIYMDAEAELVPDDEIDEAMATFSRHGEKSSLPAWTRANVEGEAKHRLYRATASAQFVLDEHDERVPVEL